MKRLTLFTFLFSSFVMAEMVPADTQALESSAWYIKQITHNIIPAADNPTALEPFVSIDTLSESERVYMNNGPEEDYFLKVQDFTNEDWSKHISIDPTITDPVCTNVYLTFGTDESSQKVIDCMVGENGVWRIKSMATRHQLLFSPIENNPVVMASSVTFVGLVLLTASNATPSEDRP